MQWLQSILRSEPSKVLQLAVATAVLRYETYGEAGRRNLDDCVHNGPYSRKWNNFSPGISPTYSWNNGGLKLLAFRFREYGPITFYDVK